MSSASDPSRPPPLVDRLGFPTPGHPESLAAELPGADEEWLAGLAARLWPAEEYVALIQEHMRRARWQQ